MLPTTKSLIRILRTNQFDSNKDKVNTTMAETFDASSLHLSTGHVLKFTLFWRFLLLGDH